MFFVIFLSAGFWELEENIMFICPFVLKVEVCQLFYTCINIMYKDLVPDAIWQFMILAVKDRSKYYHKEKLDDVFFVQLLNYLAN